MGMDEKFASGNPGMPLIPPRRGLSPGRFLLAVAYLVVVGFIYCFFQQNPNHPLRPHTAHYHAAQQPSAPETVIKMVEPAVERELVPLEAHIMSKCPDAKDCLRDLVLPVMQKTLDKVNFTLSFIGRPTEHDDGVACKHGAEESRQHHRALRSEPLPRPQDLSWLCHVLDQGLPPYSPARLDRGLRPRACHRL
ncbi:hypothetical protein QBC41DRAFT_10877 [Cercophora samala]|uniref:Uncharacterized protein n=1 Tax=Cercophora samala TaxID=330535 RepID=A0AA39Z8K4_9PEZI|nr:hypothetical protein QBC41DRAFT_10877 [Cercophora samala]